MQDDAHKPRRPRFSLLNLLLLITTCAACVGLYGANKRRDALRDRYDQELSELKAVNRQLAEENREHRDTLGIFVVEDPEKIHTLQLPRNEGPTKYRIFLPEGRKYRFCYQVNRIPEKGVPVPESSDSRLVEPGGYLVTLQLKRTNDRETGKPTKSMRIRCEIKATDGQLNSSVGATIGVSEGDIDWILNKETGGTEYSTEGDIGRSLTLQDPANPLVVFRARAHEVVVNRRNEDGSPSSWTTRDRKGPTDGFMAWIEPVEEDADE